jgi:hypothetical protein
MTKWSCTSNTTPQQYHKEPNWDFQSYHFPNLLLGIKRLTAREAESSVSVYITE